jgi:hypothetical protein
MSNVRNGWKADISGSKAYPEILMLAVRKLMVFLGELSASTAMMCWFQYASIEMSWAGHRPLAPDRSSGMVIPVDDHGILYVSQSDINFQHYFVAPGLIFGGVGITMMLVAWAMGDPLKPQRRESFKRVGTIAEIAFIAFLPVWLLANPFEALARAIRDPERLLTIDIAIGLLWVGWWTLMQSGTVFKSIPRQGALAQRR